MRENVRVELDERDYAKKPLTVAELEEIFKGHDPREFLNRKSSAFKAKGLGEKELSPEEALRLMAEDHNLIKRPLIIVGKQIVAGFDREKLRSLLA